mmetsp:Transcript_73010/g.227544  ORF Transcript_73010/g.227544 Transcript_73010/m.227544 type:complete len:241 (-) Transcript_73010:597-1319(-)
MRARWLQPARIPRTGRRAAPSPGSRAPASRGAGTSCRPAVHHCSVQPTRLRRGPPPAPPQRHAPGGRRPAACRCPMRPPHPHRAPPLKSLRWRAPGTWRLPLPWAPRAWRRPAPVRLSGRHAVAWSGWPSPGATRRTTAPWRARSSSARASSSSPPLPAPCIAPGRRRCARQAGPDFASRAVPWGTCGSWTTRHDLVRWRCASPSSSPPDSRMRTTSSSHTRQATRACRLWTRSWRPWLS